MTNTMSSSYTSFMSHKRIASGSLAANALAVKHITEAEALAPLLTFCDQTGQVVDLDLRGSDAEMLARLNKENVQLETNQIVLTEPDKTVAPRVRGRPNLGVVPREVTLLPRHWEWLAAQPGGASVTLRKLVDEARRALVDTSWQRRATESAYHFMSTMAGDMPGFEEASRALFANDVEQLRKLIEAWPTDIRNYVFYLAYELPLTEIPCRTGQPI